MQVIFRPLLVGLIVLLSACESTTPIPATNPVLVVRPNVPTPTGQHHFESADGGVAINYPDGWEPTRIANDLSTLRVQLPSGVAHFTLNIPKLPWHPAWVLTIDRVKSHYLDDRKQKRFTAGVTVTEETPLSFPNSQVDHLKMHGPFQGQPYFEEAVMIVHNDKVYILDISGNDPGYPAAKALLDVVVKSLKWTQ